MIGGAKPCLVRLRLILVLIDLGIDRFSGRRTSDPIRNHNEAASASRRMRTHRPLQRDYLPLISGPVTG